MTLGDVLSAKLANVSRVQTSIGVFVQMVGGLARVNIEGATVDIRCDGWTPPAPGMPVRVETIDGVMRVTSPSQALSPRGEVLASADSDTRAVVLVDGVEYTLPVMAPYVPAPTNLVVIDWQSGFVLGEQAAAPASGGPDTLPGGSTPFTGLLIQPTASGKYDTNWDNWWAPPEVWASNVNKGIWVYGRRHTALTGADIDKTEFFFPPPLRAVGSAFIGLHTYSGIPGGEPTITDMVAVPVDRRSGWFECPAWWGNHLRDNPDAGIGVTSGAGDNRWPGVGQAGGSQSGWLRFAGTR